MPAFEHHYIPLHPAPATKEECDELAILGTLNYDTKAEVTLVVRLLGTEAKGIRVIAIALPEAGVGHETLAKWFKQIVETALASIRLTYDQDAQPEYTTNGFMNLMTQTDDPEPEYGFPIQITHNADWRLNINNVMGVFGDIHGKGKADIAALLAESLVSSLPPHYAVLSLVRAIELLWPVEADLHAILNAREAEFAALEISQRPFRNALPELRNKCAHAHGRGRGEPEPWVGLGYNNPVVRPLKLLLTSIVARGLRDIYSVAIQEAGLYAEPQT